MIDHPLQLVADDEPPHPAEHKLLSRTVADWLAERIISGEEEPGARLTETKLAEEAGVSRSPVREALRILQGEGLVDIVPRYGAQVAYIGIADVEELYACRMLLEPICTGLSVEALEPDDVRELDILRRRMERAVELDDPRRFLAENIAYFAHSSSTARTRRSANSSSRPGRRRCATGASSPGSLTTPAARSSSTATCTPPSTPATAKPPSAPTG